MWLYTLLKIIFVQVENPTDRRGDVLMNRIFTISRVAAQLICISKGDELCIEVD